MADFNLSNRGSNLNLSNVKLDYTSKPKPGDHISGGNLFRIYGSNDPVGVTASVNNVPVFSNNSPALYNPNNAGSSINYAGSTTPLDSGSSGMSTYDKWSLALAGLSTLYGIYNSERNYRNEREAYEANRKLQNQYYNLEANGLTNLANQYAQVGLNPLAVSGNGTSYSQPSPLSAPQHGSIDFLTTLKLVDNLKTAKAERDLLEAQALRQKTLAAAQTIVNEKNYAQIEKWGFENGFTKAKIDKTIKEAKRIMQLIDVTGYDLDLSKMNNQRYKDSTDKWVKLLETIAGFVVPEGVDLKTALSSPTSETQKQQIFNGNPMYIYKR